MDVLLSACWTKRSPEWCDQGVGTGGCAPPLGWGNKQYNDVAWNQDARREDGIQSLGQDKGEKKIQYPLLPIQNTLTGGQWGNQEIGSEVNSQHHAWPAESELCVEPKTRPRSLRQTPQLASNVSHVAKGEIAFVQFSFSHYVHSFELFQR